MSDTRRTFIKRVGTGVAALGWTRAARSAPPSDRVVLGVIGCGGRGRHFVPRATYVCDTDARRLATAVETAQVPASHGVTDMRRILDNPDIDAVVIATPDHWHAPAAILACEAGKHVYVEKPCSHNFRESRLLLDAARRNNVVVQHGTQQRSMPFALEAVQMLRDGLIGDVLLAKAWNVQLRGNIGHGQPSDPPPGVDYDTWVGPAEWVPFQENRFHYNWHWWYNFGTGDIGNDGSHELDLARWGLGVDVMPARISGLGGKFFHDDDQQFPDTATCVFDYPGDGNVGNRRQLVFEMRLWSTNYPQNCDNGVEFHGTKGQMFFSKRGKLQVRGERNKMIHNRTPKIAKHTMEHLDDFFHAIRTGSRPSADIQEAHRSVALVHLANIAVRTGRSLQFDAESEQIVGDGESNQLLGRTYRKEGHWAVPQGV